MQSASRYSSSSRWCSWNLETYLTPACLLFSIVANSRINADRAKQRVRSSAIQSKIAYQTLPKDVGLMLFLSQYLLHVARKEKNTNMYLVVIREDSVMSIAPLLDIKGVGLAACNQKAS